LCPICTDNTIVEILDFGGLHSDDEGIVDFSHRDAPMPVDTGIIVNVEHGLVKTLGLFAFDSMKTCLPFVSVVAQFVFSGIEGVRLEKGLRLGVECVSVVEVRDVRSECDCEPTAGVVSRVFGIHFRCKAKRRSNRDNARDSVMR